MIFFTLGHGYLRPPEHVWFEKSSYLSPWNLAGDVFLDVSRVAVELCWTNFWNAIFFHVWKWLRKRPLNSTSFSFTHLNKDKSLTSAGHNTSNDCKLMCSLLRNHPMSATFLKDHPLNKPRSQVKSKKTMWHLYSSANPMAWWQFQASPPAQAFWDTLKTGVLLHKWFEWANRGWAKMARQWRYDLHMIRWCNDVCWTTMCHDDRLWCYMDSRNHPPRLHSLFLGLEATIFICS